jgi:hypothetical protein
LKQGKASCGVARQYTGSAGKITNCQIGVFASYVSRHGHAFIDRALYLPKEWTDDRPRLKAARAMPLFSLSLPCRIRAPTASASPSILEALAGLSWRSYRGLVSNITAAFCLFEALSERTPACHVAPD